MGLLRKFEPILSRSSFLTISKTFIRSRLDYADIIYDQAYNSAGAILYQELGLESLRSSRWFRKLCHFYKIFNNKSRSYLFNVIPIFNRVHNTRLNYNIPPIKVRHDYFKNSFFPSSISDSSLSSTL